MMGMLRIAVRDDNMQFVGKVKDMVHCEAADAESYCRFSFNKENCNRVIHIFVAGNSTNRFCGAVFRKAVVV